MLFSLELTLAGLGVCVYGGEEVICPPPQMRPIPPECVYTHTPPWLLWSLRRRETRATPDTPSPQLLPTRFPASPPFLGEPCGWACACGESHPSIILVTDRHEADGDNIPSQLPTDESPSRCRPEASGFFSLRNISVPTQWLNVAARVRQAHICGSSSLHPAQFQGLVESPYGALPTSLLPMPLPLFSGPGPDHEH